MVIIGILILFQRPENLTTTHLTGSPNDDVLAPEFVCRMYRQLNQKK